MKNALLKRIAGELDTIIRLKEIDEDKLTNELIDWLDYEYHGIMKLPCVTEKDVTPDRAEPLPLPDKKTKAGT